MNDPAPPSDLHAAPARAGDRLGPWELREVIGSGGMGEVWSATRSDGLHHGRAAVKLLHSARADASMARLMNARFGCELSVVAPVVDALAGHVFEHQVAGAVGGQAGVDRKSVV